VTSMAASCLPGASSIEITVIASLVQSAHKVVRGYDGDSSAVSLRDVKRFLTLVTWFGENFPKVGDKVHQLVEERQQGTKGSKEPATAGVGRSRGKPVAMSSGGGDKRPAIGLSTLATSVALALAHVYYYRLGSASIRRAFWQEMQYTLRRNWVHLLQARGWVDLSLSDGWAWGAVLDFLTDRFATNMVMEEGIALNAALKENLFVVIVCILNKLPVFIVGKPGSSKTLTMQVCVQGDYCRERC